MADDFERAVLFSFQQNTSSSNYNNNEERTSALQQLEQFVLSPDAWKVCAERFETSSSSEVKFWCLQTLAKKLSEEFFNEEEHFGGSAVPSPASASSSSQFSQEDRQLLRNTIEKYVSIFQCQRVDDVFPMYIQNKLAECVAHAITSEGPAKRWPNFFENFASVLVNANAGGGDTNTSDADDKKSRAAFFLRILDCLDADVINSTDALRKGALYVRKSGRVKDYMRENNIVSFLFDTFLNMANSFSSDAKILAHILIVASKYVDWVDVNIIASDGFMSFVSACSGHTNEDLRAASCLYLTALIDKGMDAEKKFVLITRFNLVEACSSLVAASFRDDDEQFAMKSLQLLQTLGNELLNMLNAISPIAVNSKGGKSSVKERSMDCLRTPESEQLCNLLLVLATQAAMYGIPSKHESAVSASSQFLIQYSNRMKNDNYTLALSIPMVQETLLKNIIDRSSFEFVNEFGADFANGSDPYVVELECDVFALRHELMVLFRNISRAAPEIVLRATQAAIESAFNTSSSNNNNNNSSSSGGSGEVSWYRVDAALSALYNLGESSGFTDAVVNFAMKTNPNNAKDKSNSIQPLQSNAAPQEHIELTSLVLSVVLKWDECSKSAAYHRIVSMSYMELCVRYHNMIEQNAEALHLALRAFLDERGMRHPDSNVSSRACYLFMRMVKPVRSHLADKLDDIFTALEKPLSDAAAPLSSQMLEAIQAKVAQLASNLSIGTRAQAEEGNDDRLYVFEAAGSILGAEEVPEDKQCERLMQVCQVLCGRIVEFVNVTDAENGALASQNAMRCVVALSNLSKGFSARICVQLRPKVGEIFRSAMEVTISCLKRWPREKGVRHRVVGYLHQMVQILNETIVPYLPDAVDSLRSNGTNSKELGETLVLINQLSNTFKEALLPMLVPLFLPLRLQVHESIRAGLSQSASSDEFTRESHELERNWVQTVNTFALTSLLSPMLAANVEARDLCLTELVENARTHNSISIRKLCLQSLKRITTDWLVGSDNTGGNPQIGGEFSNFAAQKIGIECCLIAPLFDYNFADAGAVAAVNECFAIQRVLFQKMGEPFAELLAKSVLPSLLSAKVDQAGIENCAQAYINLLAAESVKPKDIRLLLGEIAQQATLPDGVVRSPCTKS
jgi:exportin-T